MSIELRKKSHLLTRLFGKASLLRAGMLGALVLCSLISFAQEAAEYKGTIKVHNKMYNEDGSPFTAHTTNPVPFLCAGVGDVKLREGGCLADIAPTMLPYIGLPVPKEMTGKSMIEG